MQALWQEHLLKQGATLDESTVRNFGDGAQEAVAATQSNVLCDLSQYRLMPVRGEQAAEFLHNQLSVNCRNLDGTQTRLAAWCNPKGRALVLFRLFQHRDTLYLRLPSSLAARVKKRLTLFILRSKVTLDEENPAPAHIGLSGPGVVDLLQAHDIQVPEQEEQAARTAGMTVIRVPGPWPRFEIVAPTQNMIELWNALSAQARPVGEPAWRLLEILSGLPEVHPDTSEAFVPQMLNLQWLNGIDFKKGCYPGQEVIARIHYRGGLKRRLYRLQAEGTPAASPGSSIQVDDGNDKVGTVVQAASDGHHTQLLGVVKTEYANGRALALPDGNALQICELPYPVSSRTDEESTENG